MQMMSAEIENLASEIFEQRLRPLTMLERDLVVEQLIFICNGEKLPKAVTGGIERKGSERQNV